MTGSELIVRVLLEGAIGALVMVAVAFLLSRFVGDGVGRSLLVILLLVAAGAYFGFAVMARVGPAWLLVELAHCFLFGAMALRGLRGSPYWLAAGWALHPVWDFGLHYVGPGTFAPWPYTIACISFDLIVAAYVALVYGLIGPRRLGLRNDER
ncbi:MAG TPA: DUF6010 family protein [Pyrinomonadaceae bacterium]|nr:DUF6010 family protein [Pyrinomonadaceae bacterium]